MNITVPTVIHTAAILIAIPKYIKWRKTTFRHFLKLMKSEPPGKCQRCGFSKENFSPEDADSGVAVTLNRIGRAGVQ